MPRFKLKRMFANWWVRTIFIALVAAVLLAYALPLFVGAFRPLWIRVLCVLLVAACWGGVVWWRFHKARRAADAIAAGLAEPNAGDAEAQALSDRMAQALGTLRGAAGRKRDYLYSRPWYVIIGPPGAGKTTALLNSGLRFPVGEQAVGGVGGTRNLDFWFADEAAMVDTAGRYTTQDSDQAVDAKGWTSFLSLLKRHRPLQPINGVIVAIGVDELIRSDCARIDEHARAVRRRLAELRRTLEVAAPVYVLLTKADMLAGFTEYYEDLDVEGRRAVLGATLPWAAARPKPEALAHAFDEMAQAVADRQARRLFDEVDGARRALLLGFPSQVRSLRSRLMRFLDGAFVAGEEPGGVLRGFYLTSGVQEGAPLDRILSGMADVYDRPAATAGAAGRGRAYFLNRLLTETIFPEAGLVTTDPPARRRQRVQLAGAMAGIGVFAALVLVAWGLSFANNRSFQNTTLAQTGDAQGALKDSGIDLHEVRESDPDLRAALPALNQLRDLPRGYAAQQNGAPPLMWKMGLYQSGLAARSDSTYHDALRRIMLPRLLLRLEAILKANAADPAALYQPLKVYLILGGQGPMDRAAVKGYVVEDWATQVYPGSDAQVDRAQLAAHLDALLADPDLSASWPDRRAPLDGALITQTRTAVQTLSLADRAYALMKQRAASMGEPWEMSDLLSAGDAQAFADPQKVMAIHIPFFFTRKGYDKAYTRGLATVQNDLRRDLWVIDPKGSGTGLKMEMASVRPGVAGLYAQDYIAAWDTMLKTLQPGAFFANPAAYGAFTKSPSPLKRILLELARNTTFQSSGSESIAKKLINKKINRLSTMRRLNIKTSDYAGASQGLSAGDEISEYFASTRSFAGDGKGEADVDAFVGAVKAAGQAVLAARAAGGGGGADATQAAMATAVAQVQAAAAGAPPQLQSFVDAAARGGSSAQISATSGAVGDAYARAVLPGCKQVVDDHYPFVAASANDAAVPDALRLFAMGGTIDGFVQQRLAPLMDTQGPVWRWKAGDPLTASLNPATPEEFAKAAQIRDMLAGGLPFKVSLVAVGKEVGAADVSVGGSSARLAAGASDDKPLQWSVNGGVPQATVVLYGTGGDHEVGRVTADGPWALFRLMDKADKQNAGPQSFKAKFGEGARSVTILVKLPTETNPFSRGGPFSFRCPTAL